MNTQMDRQKDHTSVYGEDPHDHNAALHHTGGGHEEGEHHGEKKSVLKKVKAKAKKIKDTIKGHVGHGHDHDEDEEDDDDDEMDTDPVVHGAPASHGINVDKAGHTSERSAIGGHAPVSNPGAYKAFDTTTAHHIPGQEETLGWSRTDARIPLGSENQPFPLKHTHANAHSSGSHSTGNMGALHKPKLGGIIEKDSHVLKHSGVDVNAPNYQAKVSDPMSGGCGSTVSQDIGIGQGRGTPTSRQHGDYLGEGVTFEGGSHIPVSKPVEYQTFDTTTSRYTPGQDETLGWSRTDTGRARLSDEQPYAPKNTPVVDRPGHYHTGVRETGEMGESGKIGGILDRPITLEKDPHAPRDVGERRYADNYQTKVTDPTGRAGEEIGVTPILHQLGKMNIHDETAQKSDSYTNTGQQEQLFRPDLGQHQSISTGSHDQFSAEQVNRPQSDATIPISQGSYSEEQQKPESYTEKISSVASELASKAKQATGSVTSKLGYGGTHETPTNAAQQPALQSLDKNPVQGGYGETLSNVSNTIRDTAVHAKDAVASKLGYGETREGSGPKYEVGSIGGAPDKGVSMKEYLVEKLKPSEEDKALSKVITEALPLHTQKEGNPVDETTKVEIKERMTGSGEEKKVVIKGRVTESEEVANRLGRAEDTSYDGAGPGLASPGKTVMDRIRDAAGSWFSPSGGPSGEPHAESDAPIEGNVRIQTSTVREHQQ